jgi:murein L,D-transpeptidase YafK
VSVIASLPDNDCTDHRIAVSGALLPPDNATGKASLQNARIAGAEASIRAARGGAKGGGEALRASCRCTPFVAHPGIIWRTLLWLCPTKATDDKHSDGKGSTSGGLAMIRATVVRALLLATALAAALTPVTCLGVDSNQLPTRATKELPPALLALLRQKKMPKHSPILVRIFKEEAELEVWKQDTSGHFELLKIFPICRWSGDLGPKLHQGDRQAPEGFYTVTPELMNPNSNYYLAINTGFPNSFDKANNRNGSLLMIHGDCSSMGCYAMTDEQISEIYSLARDSLLGRPSFQVQAYPFRMTPANLARHRTHPQLAFWKMLKIGNDHFETTHLEPKVDVCDRRYVFDAQAAPNSPNPLVFNPIGKCPAFVVNPKIARQALEKQRADEAEYAQLLEDDVPAAPIYSGLDGGMNEVFLARFPVRVTLAQVLPYASYLPQLPPIPWINDDGSLTSKWFGTCFEYCEVTVGW